VALEGFQVTRSLAGRAASATNARATLTVTAARPPVTLAGRINTATQLSAALFVVSAHPPPGPFAVFRNRVATALGGLADDWEVHPVPVDAITPPAFVLVWGDPWTTPATHCHDLALMEIVCIAARIDVEPGYETLETMVATAKAALNRAGLAQADTTAPRPFEVGGLTYLAARIQVRNTVNIGSN
jgi:hypothetical protein